MMMRTGFLMVLFLSSCLFGWSEVEVIEAARHSGGFGLRVSVVGASQTELVNEDITVPDAFRARFYLRLDGLSLSAEQSVPVFAGQSAGGEDLFRVLVARVDDAYRLGFEVRLDNGTYAAVPPVVGPLLASGWRAIEFSWSAGADGGYLHFLLDGNLQAGLEGLDNDASALAAIRLGLLDVGPSGFVDFDDYEARKRGPIGTLCLTGSEILGQLANWAVSQSVLNLVAFVEESCADL